jgi:coenzyme F420-dependent glucose-6-phosphate dehydrogenase
MEVGYAISSEELDPNQIVRAAARAEEAGFSTAWVSDHFHPWIDAQGESPFVWSSLGGIATVTERMRVGTGVTCPTVRIHPAIIAHAAATTQVMFDGRFFLGVGTGENLNEHIVGQRWPEAAVRIDMLEEAVGVIRQLWSGRQESHHGRYFTVENARIYTMPDTPPPIYVSAFGPHAVEMAARCGDGLVSTRPDRDLLQKYDDHGGRGPKLGQIKVCWAERESDARELAWERWPTSGLIGELSQELPTPKHFEQAVAPLHEEDVVSSFSLGPDPEPYLESLAKYADAGYDEVYITQIGPDQDGFLRFFERELRPALETQFERHRQPA